MKSRSASLCPTGSLAAILLAVAVIVAPRAPASANPPDASAVLGVWLDESRAVAIEFYPCADELCAKIVWLARPLKRDGVRIKRDDRNPDPALRTRPYCGIETIRGLRSKREGVWSGGKFYYPKRGETYDVEITLEGENRLELRAYLGIKLFGKKETWTRAEDNKPPGDCPTSDPVKS